MGSKESRSQSQEAWDCFQRGRHRTATVLNDTLSTTFPDVDHSSAEARFVTVGMSSRGRILVVVDVEDGDRIRIISARPATSHERRFYEEGQ